MVDVDTLDELSVALLATVARTCFDTLRARKSRRDKQLGPRLPDPLVARHEEGDPTRHVPQTDTISLALLVVLETLTPAERVVFVLHDMFAVPFEQIAAIVERAPPAVRQLEQRARRRVSSVARALREPAQEGHHARLAVEAFLAAAKSSDFDALLAVLDPDVLLRTDRGAVPLGGASELRGAGLVAKQTLSFAKLTERAQRVFVNAGPGLITWLPGGHPFAVLGFSVIRDKIVELYVFADPSRLARLDLTALSPVPR